MTSWEELKQILNSESPPEKVILSNDNFDTDLLEKDEIAERDQKAEWYMYRCLGYKVLHPWKWWFKRLVGGVWQ